jgi:hypothetical protein
VFEKNSIKTRHTCLQSHPTLMVFMLKYLKGGK